MAWRFRRNHEDIEIISWVEQVEMHVEPVRECERGARPHIPLQVRAVEIGLVLVRRQNHDDISRLRCLSRARHFQACGLRLRDTGGAGAKTNDDIRDTAIAQIQGMGVTLTAESDDGDGLALYQADIRVPIVIHSHG
jgi:hypothetical protein